MSRAPLSATVEIPQRTPSLYPTFPFPSKITARFPNASAGLRSPSLVCPGSRLLLPKDRRAASGHEALLSGKTAHLGKTPPRRGKCGPVSLLILITFVIEENMSPARWKKQGRFLIMPPAPPGLFSRGIRGD